MRQQNIQTTKQNEKHDVIVQVTMSDSILQHIVHN
jgi:hypothetical protein